MSGRNDIFFDRQGRAAAAHHAAKMNGRCTVCGKTAIYRVGTKGYCREHHARAVLHATQVDRQRVRNARRDGTAFDQE